MDDRLSRVAAIADGAGQNAPHLAEYDYLGASTIVRETFPQPAVRLDYVGDGSYSGFDRFGRVVDQLWEQYAAGQWSAVDEYRYGYDAAGNRLWKGNVVAANQQQNLDELYSYDGLSRLVAANRGDLNAARTAIADQVFAQDWGLDATGNWADFNQNSDGQGEYDLAQQRAVNSANEIVDVNETQGQPAWVTPGYDAAGNMTTLPKTSDPTIALTAVYDAWNRLVEVKQGNYTIVRYEYDGLGRRIVRNGSTEGVLTEARHYFVNEQNQVLEERVEASPLPNPGSLIPVVQYVWSPRYIDAAICRDTLVDGQIDADARLYYLNDANYNVTALVSATGSASAEVVERYVFDAYGAVTIYAGDWSATRASSSVGNTVTYAGCDIDPTTGLSHNRARWYSIIVGSFIVRDPLGYRGGLSMYEYANGSPTGGTDPSGLVTYETKFATAKHHWFPQKHRTVIESLCKTVNFKIDAFVTSLLVANDEPILDSWERAAVVLGGQAPKRMSNPKYNDHDWIEHWRDPAWRDIVADKLAQNKTCCTFLTSMLPEIQRAYSELQARARARGNEKLYAAALDDALMPYPGGHGSAFPGYVFLYDGEEMRTYSYAQIRTTALLIRAIRDACSDDCPDPVDVHKWVIDRRKIEGTKTRGIDSDFLPAIIVGSLGAAALPSAAASTVSAGTGVPLGTSVEYVVPRTAGAAIPVAPPIYVAP